MNVVEVKNVRIGEGMTKICVPMVAPTEYDVDMQIRTCLLYTSPSPRDRG